MSLFDNKVAHNCPGFQGMNGDACCFHYQCHVVDPFHSLDFWSSLFVSVFGLPLWIYTQGYVVNCFFEFCIEWV
jgi:hypothetical protein